jgi:hypothetical protein
LELRSINNFTLLIFKSKVTPGLPMCKRKRNNENNKKSKPGELILNPIQRTKYFNPLNSKIHESKNP